MAEVDRVEVDGLTIAYERVGTGPPLVLLHGGLSDHREWRAQLDGLSDAFTVVAWDAPGCGGSSDPPATFRFPDYAACLAGFVEALDLANPHVLGLSWGSTLALALYGIRPDLPQSLLLTAAYAGWAGSLPPDEVERRIERALVDLDGPPSAIVDTFMPTLFTDRAPREMLESTAAMLLEHRAAGTRPMLLAMAEADLRGVLPTIAVPTLLLYGAEDVRSPLDVARAMQATIPGASLVVLPEVGHQCNIEAPDAFNHAVRGFLRPAR